MKSVTLGLLGVWCWLLVGCSSEEPAPGPKKEAAAPIETEPVGRSEDLPRPEIATRPLDVHTVEPGSVVFVNGQPARTLTGELLLTPCQVQIPSGESAEVRITVAKEGVEDSRQSVMDSSQAELNFADATPTKDFTQSLLASPLLHAEVGRPVALLSLNSPGQELDPYLEPNGLAIWFVADRSEGRAIYRAERESPYAFFNPPVIFRTTQGSELPASPSVMELGKLVYALPERNRIQSIATNDDDYDRPEVLQFGTKPHRLWEGAQILRNGLELYWTERSQGSKDQIGFVCSRSSESEPFKDVRPFSMPGSLPCLSADGLRQYLFDGRILKRARRARLEDRFASPEIIANVNLPDYRHDPHRRLFWVSEHEEWLFYSASAAGGDLYAVRLFNGPGWGYAPRGEAITPRVKIAKTKPVDPGTLPFIPPDVKAKPTDRKPPYPKFREEFVGLLKDRQYRKADQLLSEALKNPAFQKDQDVLKWDREDWQAVTGFWDALRERFRTMPKDTIVSIRAAKVKFVKFEEDVIHYRTSREGTKPLLEMHYRDLLKILEPTLTPENTKAQMQAALFLFYDAQGSKDLAENYLQDAGKEGVTVRNRVSERLLHSAKRELAEGRLPESLAYLERIKAEYPGTPAAETAKAIEADVYKQVAWNPVGPRKWNEPEPGAFVADKTRQPGSYLLSPKTYSHFELHSEWKITEPQGSGGVFFRFAAPGREDPYRKAFKLQLADDEDFQPDPQSTGALHTYEAPSENASKARGEWNTLRLRVRNLNVEVWINGKLVLDTVAQNDMVPLQGFIALDGVNGGIAYRKLLLVELPPTVE